MTPEQLAIYARDGWLRLPALIDAKAVTRLQQASASLEESASGFDVDTTVRGVFFEMQSASGRKREPAMAPGMLRKITGPSKAQPAFAKLRKDQHITALLKAVGLADPRCVIDQINFKHPRVGTNFPFHQDAGFLFGLARADFEACGGAHLVIALDAADADNGGFVVLGGTHTQGLVDLTTSYDTSTMNEGLFDESKRELVPLQPGDAILFHPLLAHGSGRNPSDRRRRLVTLWFVGGRADAPLGR